MSDYAYTIAIVPCSGIGEPYGKVSRIAAYQVTEDDRPEQTRLVPLAPLVMGDKEYGRIVAENPSITIDGCTQACAMKVVQQSGGRVLREFAMPEVFRSHRDLKPQDVAELYEDGERLAVALAREIVAEVDAFAVSVDRGEHAGQTATYNTVVTWKDGQWRHIVRGSGSEMDFSAPTDAQGHPGLFTPEDAFVAAANTSIMMMFIWTAKRFKLQLLSYDCKAEGTKRIELDRSEIFTHLRFWPVIHMAAGDEEPEEVRARTERALQAARKHSLVANSVRSEIIIEAKIEIVSGK